MNGRSLAAGLALVLLATGCATIKQTIDPATAQLERFKEFGAARRYAEIAGEEVHCTKAGEVCRQLHLIKGDACFELARRGDAAIARYECAIFELKAGLDQAPADATASGPDRMFAEKLLEALRGRRDLSASSAESVAYTVRLVQEARAFRSAYPEEPAGYYFEASGLFGRVLDEIARSGGDSATCSELEAALDLLEAGAPARGRYAVSIERITRDIRSTRRAECEA
jgi:hypothetical protein